MKGLGRTTLTWGLVLAALLAWAPALSAQDGIDVWIIRLAKDATRDQARDKLRDQGARAVPRLIKALRHPNPTIRSESAFVLGRIGRKRAVPALIAALKDKQTEVRRKAAYALGEIADARAIGALVNRLSDVEASVRANACFALGQIGDPKPARELVRALLDKDETVRNFAASALGSAGERRAVGALAWTALNDKSRYVRALAISAMGNLKDPRVCGVLVQLLENKEYLVRARAIEALLAITGNRRGYDPRDRSKARQARAPARWKAWHRQNGARLGTLKIQEPLTAYEWWYGKPKPKPKPVPVPVPVAGRDVLEPPGNRPDGPIDVTKERPGDPTRTGLDAGAVAFFKSGKKHLEMKRFQAAAQAFEACVKLVPDWTEAHFNLALAHRKLERFEQAADEFRRCLQIDPNDVEAANSLGSVCERLGRIDDAETFYRLALQSDPKNAAVRFNLAELLFTAGKPEMARPLYEEILRAEARPGDVDASLVKLRLGVCLLGAGEKVEAAKLLAQAGEETNQSFVLRETAKQFFEMGQFGKAEALLKRAYEISGGEAESAYLLAIFLLRAPDEKLRDVNAAAIYAEVAMTAEPRNPRYVSAMAEVTSAAGDKANAVTLAERALKLAPDSAAIKKQLETYRKELIEERKREQERKGEAKEDEKPGPPEAVEQ